MLSGVLQYAQGHAGKTRNRQEPDQVSVCSQLIHTQYRKFRWFLHKTDILNFGSPSQDLFSQHSLSCHLLTCNNSKCHSSSSLFRLCLQIDSELDRNGAAKSLKCCLWDFRDVRQEPGRQCSFSGVYRASNALPLSYGELVSECSAM